ncbi:MAG: hypothetical protein EOO40_03755 [Deltaproteobacteria bacterium]|nr:MAG: hypothetical protein EOO40_03755 [Deltaproteobacteria bacterium]
MQVKLCCKHCAHSWSLQDEPRALVGLECPGCREQALPRAAEDLATSLEDALCQLWAQCLQQSLTCMGLRTPDAATTLR